MPSQTLLRIQPQLNDYCISRALYHLRLEEVELGAARGVRMGAQVHPF